MKNELTTAFRVVKRYLQSTWLSGYRSCASTHYKNDVLGNAIRLAIIQNKDILAMRLIELSSTDVNAALHSRNGDGLFHGITLIQLAAFQRKPILIETLVR